MLPDGSDDDDNHGGSKLIDYARMAHSGVPVPGGQYPGLEERHMYKYPYNRGIVPPDRVYFRDPRSGVGHYMAPYVSASVHSSFVYVSWLIFA